MMLDFYTHRLYTVGEMGVQYHRRPLQGYSDKLPLTQPAFQLLNLTICLNYFAVLGAVQTNNSFLLVTVTPLKNKHH